MREIRISELPSMKQEDEILSDLANETKKFFDIPTYQIEAYSRNALRKINNPVVDELGRLCSRIIEIEADLEVTRYDLANIQQFNLYETFRFFDELSQGTISLGQFIKGINTKILDFINIFNNVTLVAPLLLLIISFRCVMGSPTVRW